MVDNYDSFTYNLVQYLGELGAELEVVRNDAATVDELLERGYDRVVVSPGPCTPNEAGHLASRSCAASRRPACRRSASASATSRSRQAFGGKVVRHVPVHGKTTEISTTAQGSSPGLPNPLHRRRATTRSSWTPTCPDVLERDRPRRRRADGDAPPRRCPPTASSSTPSPCSRPTASGCWRTSLPNPVLTEAIDALAVAPATSSSEQTAGGAGRDHGRQRLRGGDRRRC